MFNATLSVRKAILAVVSLVLGLFAFVPLALNQVAIPVETRRLVEPGMAPVARDAAKAGNGYLNVRFDSSGAIVWPHDWDFSARTEDGLGLAAINVRTIGSFLTPTNGFRSFAMQARIMTPRTSSAWSARQMPELFRVNASIDPPHAFGVASQRAGQSSLSFASQAKPLAITNDTWKGGTGTWSTASGWSTGAVPSSNNNVLICGGCGKTSSVTLNESDTINNLTVDSTSSLIFANNTTLVVDGGAIANAGAITINGGNGTNTQLTLGANTALTGAGTLTLNSATTTGGGEAYIDSSGVILTNSSTIQGDGIIGNGSLTLNNQTGGVVDANSTGNGVLTSLTLNGSAASGAAVNNAGLLEATNDGVLVITNTVNNSGGNITANGSAATVALVNGADIQGGTLNSINGGTFENASNNTNVTLDGSTHGALTVSKGSTYVSQLNTQTVTVGAITNNGNIVLDGGAGTNTALTLGGNTTLQGTGGTVTMNTFASPAGGSAYIQGNGFTLTNASDTIQGEGVIGNGSLVLINQSGGIIDANSTGTTQPGGLTQGLTLNGSGNVTNTGLMEATNNGWLVIANTVNNSGGNITANGSAATVALVNGAAIQGGTLNAINGGTFETYSGQTDVTLDGSSHGALTLSKGSTYLSTLNTQTVILGTINNNGSIVLDGGGDTNTYLTLAENTTLQGTGGTVNMNTIAAPAGGNAFIQGNSITLTNTNNTIEGEGVIGNGSLALVNESGGIIDANSTGTGQIGGPTQGLTLNGSGNVTNAGLMEATNDGVLVIANTVNNSGGNITANGSAATVALVNGALIQGGTLNAINGGTFENPSGNTNVTLDGRSVAQGGVGTLTIKGTYISEVNTETNLLGTINNTGNIQVNSGFGNNSYLVLGTTGATNVTLQDGGTVTLNTFSGPGGGASYIQAANTDYTLTNVNNTIQGSGVIGNGSLGLINQGTVNANSTGANSEALSLTLNGSQGVTNTGLLEATNEGQLVITNTVNNSGGNITANGSAATVELVNGADIQGGTLNTANGGTIVNVQDNTNVTLDGSSQGALTLSKGTNYVSQLNTQTVTLGTINNSGSIVLDGGAGTNTELTLAGNTTLQGSGGTVTMNTFASPAGGSAYIQGNGFTLTNTNNTIQGAGVIGNGSLAVVNGGTIFANAPGQTLLLNGSGSITNNGTLEVASSSVLHLTNGSFTNFASNTLSGGTYNVAGILEIDELGTSGGEIVTNAANIILNGASSSFIDADGNNALSALNTNATGSSFTIEGGRNFTTAGAFTNKGTLTVGSGSLFDVNGNLTEISGTTISGGTYNLSGTLKANNASGITTNSASITLTGTGALENQAGTNALTGLATNSSGASFTINGGADFTTKGAFTNNGTLTVGNASTFNSAAGNYTNAGTTTVQTGGTFTAAGTLASTGTFTNGGTLGAATGKTLTLDKGTYANTGGTILASGTGTEVLLDGATISGGTLSSASGGGLVAENSATLNGSTNAVTLSTGSSLEVNNGQTLEAVGTLTNNGAFTLNSTGTSTELLLTGNTTLGGTGTLTLSNNAGNIISAAATTDVLTNSSTIQGAGNIGDGNMGVVNSGTINANQSTPLLIDTSSAGFKNTGTLSVSSGDTLHTEGGTFANFSGSTLTGGTYNVSGTLEIAQLGSAGGEIVTNAANITLNGTGSSFVDGGGKNALANLSTNATDGSFTLSGGRTFTTAGNFTNNGTLTVTGSGSKLDVTGSAASNTSSGTFNVTSGGAFAASGNFTNAGTLSVGTGSTFSVGSASSLTQTGGTTTDDGTITVGTGGFDVNGGKLFGDGSVTGNVISSGIVTPGNSSTATGKETITGTYTQNSGGALDISIGGTTAGTNFDQLDISSKASLNGTLNVTLINGFVPTIGETFDILDSSSETGNFSTVNGEAINSSEHFTESCSATGCVLTVVAGALPTTAHSTTKPDFNHLLAIPISRRIGLPMLTTGGLDRPVYLPRGPEMSGEFSMPRAWGLPPTRAAFGSGSATSFSAVTSASSKFIAPRGVPLLAITRPGFGSDSATSFPAVTLTSSKSIGPRGVPLLATTSLHPSVVDSPVFQGFSRFSSDPSLRGMIAAAAGLGTSVTRLTQAAAEAASDFRGSQGGAVFGSNAFRVLPDFNRFAETLKAPRAGLAIPASQTTRTGHGFSGLKGRTLMGGFTLPASNLLSKPKLGFAFE